MRILIAGATNPLAKAFIKKNKKLHELIALDEKAADFSDYWPVREVFRAYRFDAVLYMTAIGSFGASAVCSGDITLLKNLAYAAALQNARLLVVSDAEPRSFFNGLAAGVCRRGGNVTLLRVFGLIGKGLSARTNPVMKLLSDANKTGQVALAADRAVSLVHTDDVLGAVSGLLDGGLEGGCIDLCQQKPTTLAGIARTAKRILGGVELKLLQKISEPDYVGDDVVLKQALPKFKLVPQSTAIERVLGNV